MATPKQIELTIEERDAFDKEQMTLQKRQYIAHLLRKVIFPWLDIIFYVK
jgi:hypothetical protein